MQFFLVALKKKSFVPDYGVQNCRNRGYEIDVRVEPQPGPHQGLHQGQGQEVHEVAVEQLVNGRKCFGSLGCSVNLLKRAKCHLLMNILASSYCEYRICISEKTRFWFRTFWCSIFDRVINYSMLVSPIVRQIANKNKYSLGPNMKGKLPIILTFSSRLNVILVVCTVRNTTW